MTQTSKSGGESAPRTGGADPVEAALSSRARALEPSPTLGMAAKARNLSAKGVKVVSFAAGEPDFDTPEPAKRATIEALNGGFTKYVASGGIPELRKAIAEKLEKENGLAHAPNEVIVTCGGKHACYLVAQVLLDAGDEAIVLSPYWVTYPAVVALAGAKTVVVPCREEDAFMPDPAAIGRAITPRTKLLILNSPNNPTGAVFSEARLREIAEICVKRDVWILSDEIYEPMVYGGNRHVSIASFGDAVKARTITANGHSKAYAMTGWRLGYVAAPARIARAMDDWISQSTSNVTSFAQKGAVEALRSCGGFVREMCAAFEKRRDLIVRLLNEVPGFRCAVPGGAFYAFPNVQGALSSKSPTSEALANRLLEEAHVATVHGEAFGAPGYLRLSYACAEEQIEEGCRRIRDALK